MKPYKNSSITQTEETAWRLVKDRFSNMMDSINRRVANGTLQTYYWGNEVVHNFQQVEIQDIKQAFKNMWNKTGGSSNPFANTAAVFCFMSSYVMPVVGRPTKQEWIELFQERAWNDLPPDILKHIAKIAEQVPEERANFLFHNFPDQIAYLTNRKETMGIIRRTEKYPGTFVINDNTLDLSVAKLSDHELLHIIQHMEGFSTEKEKEAVATNQLLSSVFDQLMASYRQIISELSSLELSQIAKDIYEMYNNRPLDTPNSDSRAIQDELLNLPPHLISQNAVAIIEGAIKMYRMNMQIYPERLKRTEYSPNYNELIPISFLENAVKTRSGSFLKPLLDDVKKLTTYANSVFEQYRPDNDILASSASSNTETNIHRSRFPKRPQTKNTENQHQGQPSNKKISHDERDL